MSLSFGCSEMGTADALRLLRDKIHHDFIVMSCDFISTVPLHSLIDVHRVNDAAVTVLLVQQPPRSVASVRQ